MAESTTPDLDSLYQQWRTDCQRDYTELAQHCAIPHYELRAIGARYAWSERAHDDDARDMRDRIEGTIVLISKALPKAGAVIDCALSAVSNEYGKPRHLDPDQFTPAPTAINSAWKLVSIFGIAPAKIHTLLLGSESQGSSIEPATIAAWLADGNIAALLAAAQGRAVPAHAYPAPEAIPGDFLSTHAEGRAGLGTLDPVSQPNRPAESAKSAARRGKPLSPEEWDAANAIDAEIVEVANGRRKRDHD